MYSKEDLIVLLEHALETVRQYPLPEKRKIFLSIDDLTNILGVSKTQIRTKVSNGAILSEEYLGQEVYPLISLIENIRLGHLIISGLNKEQLLERIKMSHPQLSRLCNL